MSAPATRLPDELDTRRLRRRALQIVAGLVVLALIAWLTPGLGDARRRLEQAAVGWVLVGVLLEVLSSLSYAVMFRPLFCSALTRRTSLELALSEVGVGSLVPASGAGGLALGVWALRRAGMPPDQIGRRTVAFFLVKSATNFVAVAVVGVLILAGVLTVGAPASVTAAFTAASVLVIAVVLALPRLAPNVGGAGRGASRFKRARVFAGRSLSDGVREAVGIVRSGNPLAIGGSLGYWAFDNAVLWATYHAVGNVPPIGVILMGYLVGQLGGALPIPGGIGGIDGGLIGVLVLYGAPLNATVAAVLIYRLILFWIPLMIGAVAFTALRRGLNQPHRPDLCSTAAA